MINLICEIICIIFIAFCFNMVLFFIFDNEAFSKIGYVLLFIWVIVMIGGSIIFIVY